MATARRADNLVVMLVGWEGIGVCSYVLIGFWFTRLSATKSALKAVLVNRVGDGMLMWAILAVWWYAGNVRLLAYSAVWGTIRWQPLRPCCDSGSLPVMMPATVCFGPVSLPNTAAVLSRTQAIIREEKPTWTIAYFTR